MGVKNIKIEPSEIIKNIRLKFRKSLWEYLFRKSGIIVVALFLLMATMSGFLIYKYLYSAGWNDAQKQSYLQKTGANKKTDFNIGKFNQIVNKINQRNKEFNQAKNFETKNVFRTP